MNKHIKLIKFLRSGAGGLYGAKKINKNGIGKGLSTLEDLGTSMIIGDFANKAAISGKVNIKNYKLFRRGQVVSPTKKQNSYIWKKKHINIYYENGGLVSNRKSQKLGRVLVLYRTK